MNNITLAKTDLSKTINSVIKDAPTRDAFVAQIKNPQTGTNFKNYADFQQFYGNANPQEMNEFFSTLTNQIGIQFVEEVLKVSLPFYKYHYRGQLAAGDFVQMTWIKPNNVIMYNKEIYTPTEFKAKGGILTNEFIQQPEPSYIKVVSGAEISPQVVKAFATKGTISAFNRLLSVIAEMLEQTIRLMFYSIQIKVLNCVNNTYTIGDDKETKPSWITNEDQWKLYYLNKLVEKFKQPSYAFNALGKVGDKLPMDPTTTITQAMLRPTCISSNSDLICYMTPSLKARFKTLTYSTTFNPEYLKVEDLFPTIETLNLDVEQPAQEYIDPKLSFFASKVNAATPALPEDTIFIGEKDAIVVYDRFNLSEQAIWMLNQRTTTFVYFGAVIIAWNNLFLKVKLTAPTKK